MVLQSLADASTINTVFAKGTKYRSPFAVIRLVKRSGSINRVAVMTSKKVFAKAVDRNRVRRRLQGLLQTTLKSRSQAYDMVIQPFKGSLVVKAGEISRFLERAFRV